MKPSRFIKVQVFNLATTDWEDITNGILSINTVTGSDTFEGYWDQPDTGQFVITTRGNTADPNLNPLITTNSIIKVFVDNVDIPGQFNDEAVFFGFITDVNVEYRKNDTQLVTINGTDLMGYLNRLVITQDFIDTNITPTYPNQVVPADYLINFATYALAPELQGIFFVQYTSALAQFGLYPEITPWAIEIPPTPRVKVEAGKTLYELIVLGMSSGLMRYETSNFPNQYVFLPYYKNDVAFYSPIESNLEANRNFYARTNETDPWQVPEIYNPLGEFTFKGITLNNGLSKMINQVGVNNTDPATGDFLTIEPVSSNVNVLNYGPAHLDAQTSYTTTVNPFWLTSSAISNQAAYFQNNILFDQAEPKTTIETITVDGARWFNDLSYNQVPDNGQVIFVQHRLDNNQYLTGFYKIVGIRHQITENEWLAEFILKPSEYETIAANRPKTPTFTVTADETPDPEGNYTTSTNFTVSINNYTTEDLAEIDNIEWMVNFYADLLNAPISPGNPPSQVKQLYDFPDLPIFNGTSVTWNFDDTGPLEGYATAINFYGTEMFGPGAYNAYVIITNKNGFKTWFDVQYFSVVGALAHADFIFTKDAQERVTFISESGPDTDTWFWEFGDGTTFNGQYPPVKQYATAGTYNVKLTVGNGFDTDSITKPVTINVYQMPVKYVRLRFQGSVTRPAGQTEYPVDLIDTIGLVEMKNELFVQTGGIQPFNIVVRNLDKVQDIGRGNQYQWLRVFNIDNPPAPNPSDPPSINTSDYDRRWVYNYSTFGTPNTYNPFYTTDYSATSVLNPMSETMWEVWNEPQGRGTSGATTPKYKFFPVITNNPDGSQTKTYDFDLIFDYSKVYYNSTFSANPTSLVMWRNFQNNVIPQTSTDARNGATYIPGGSEQTTGSPVALAPWPEWDTTFNTGPSYDQRYKLKEINVWPGLDTKVNKTTEGGIYKVPGGNTLPIYFKPVDPPLDRFGLISGKEYLPISISVSDDGVTYRKVAEAEYVSGNFLTTTYDVAMPPFSSAPIEA